MAQPTDWATKLLPKIAVASRLSATSADERAALVEAIQVVAAHKAYAYDRAFRGVTQAGEPRETLPRLAAAVALMHRHFIDINAVPLVANRAMLDPAAPHDGGMPEPAEGVAEGASDVDGAAAPQQQLF